MSNVICRSTGELAIAVRAERDRLKAINAELVGGLNHCVNVLAEYERKPGDDLRGFMLGALDVARAVLDKAHKEG